jgi:hypothetical protein
VGFYRNYFVDRRVACVAGGFKGWVLRVGVEARATKIREARRGKGKMQARKTACRKTRCK